MYAVQHIACSLAMRPRSEQRTSVFMEKVAISREAMAKESGSACSSFVSSGYESLKCPISVKCVRVAVLPTWIDYWLLVDIPAFTSRALDNKEALRC